MPDWLKITAVTERESATRIWEALDMLGALAVTVESVEDDLDFDEFILGSPKWRRQAVSGLFDGDTDCASMMAVVHQIAGPDISIITTTRVPNRDWVLDSQQAFQPLQISKKSSDLPCLVPTTNLRRTNDLDHARTRVWHRKAPEHHPLPGTIGHTETD